MKTRRFIIQKLYNFRKREEIDEKTRKCCYSTTEISCIYWSTRNLKNTIEIYGLIGIIYKFIKLDFDSKLAWIFLLINYGLSPYPLKNIIIRAQSHAVLCS